MTAPEDCTGEFDDRFLAEAEAFDALLRQGDTPSNGFDQQHGDLAAVLRLLNDVLASPATDPAAEGPSPEHEESLLRQVGRFQVVSLLGRGGFASVYRAYDQVLQRDVAIKLILGSSCDHDGETDKRLIEARAVARLSHPNIVPLYEVAHEGDVFFLISEFCDGPTLAQWMMKFSGPIDPRFAVEIIRNLADGVAHAHARGLVHRDIKPGNVLLAPTDERDALLPFTPRLTDFGLARDLESLGASAGAQQLAGTLDYMAPEQVLDNDSASRATSDVYALGVMLYRMLTGRQPHQGETRFDLLHDICTRAPDPLGKFVPRLSRDLEAICLKCLAKSRTDRYATARGLADDLCRWQQGRSVAARPLPVVERWTRMVCQAPLASSLIVAMVLVATTAALILAHANRQLVARGDELGEALRAARANEARARAAEVESRAAARDADQQRQIAEANRRTAVKVAYQSDLPLGFEAVRQGRLAEAHRIASVVERYARGIIPLGSDLRILQSLASASWVSLATHAGSVNDIVSMPGGELLLTAGADGIVRLQDIARRTVVRESNLGPYTRVGSVACSADGNLMGVGYARDMGEAGSAVEHAVALVSLDRWEVRQTIPGLPTTINGLAFSPDNRWLAIGCRYEPLLMHALDHDGDTRTLYSDRRNEDLVLSPDGRELIVFCTRNTLRRYDTRNGSVLEEVTLPEQPHHLAASPDGRWLAVSLFHHPHVLLFDFADLARPRWRLSQPCGATNCLAFSPSGTRLAAGLRSGWIVVWDLGLLPPPGQSDTAHKPLGDIPVLFQMAPHISSVTALAMPSETRVASGGDDGSVVVTNVHSEIGELGPLSEIASRRACLLPDGESILVGGIDGSLAMYTLGPQRLERLLPPRDGELCTLQVSPNGSLLALSWTNLDMALMHLPSRKVLRMETAADLENPAQRYVEALAFDSQGHRLAMVRDANAMQVWQCPLEELVATPPEVEILTVARWTSERNASAICFLEAEGQLAYGGPAEDMRRVDLASAAEHVHVAGVPPVTALLYDRARRALVSGHANGLIFRHDEHGTQIAVCSHSSQPFEAARNTVDVSAFALSPDGGTLVSGNVDGEVRIWDAMTLRYLGTLRERDGRGVISDICFSRDGTRLLIHQCLRRDDTRCGVQLIVMQPPLPTQR